MKKIKIEEDKTVNELIGELHPSSASYLIGVNKRLLSSEEMRNRKLKKGDKVSLIPLLDGG